MPSSCRVGSALTCGLLLVVASSFLFAEPASTYRGRRLVELLEELRQRGFNLVFSSAVVRDDLVIALEPEATEPRALLEEVLAPLGLEAQDGPGGSILIVRSAGTILGRVFSATRSTPIAGAAVRVVGTGAQGITRPDGTFQIPGIPAGIHEVVIEALGFVTSTVSGVLVRADAPSTLTVALGPQPSHVEQIVVTPSRHSLVRQEQASRLTVDTEDTVLVPTFGGDVSRVIELLPGVAAADNSAAFNARGSDSHDVSLVLDGLELYEPFHLESFQSPFSVIDTKIVDRIDFLGGGFTADFGDRHGGFVEMSTALPADPHRTRIELGTLNGRVSYATPTARGSLLLSARAWYPEAFRNTIELGEIGIDPRFGDAYVKYAANVSPRTVVSAHGLLAYDHLRFVETGGNERVDASDRSGTFWLRVQGAWSQSLFSEALVSAGRLERSRKGSSEPEDEVITVDDDRTVDFSGLKEDLTWEVADSHVLRGGVSVRRLGADYQYLSADGAGPIRSLRLDPSGTSLGAYVAYRTRVTAALATELGVRWDRQTYTDDHQLSPRFNAVWQMGERSELRLGLGRFFQSQRIHELRVEDGETSFLPAELSRQADLTLQHRFPGGWRIRLDAYDRELSRLQARYENLFNPLELFPETEADRVLVSPARARLRGAELLVRGDPGRPLFWWASYAWSSAEETIDGTTVPRSWDQTHAGKFLVGYRWADRWSVSLSGTAHTGWPTTPVSAELMTQPDGSTVIVPIIGARNSIRFPGYGRLDVKASRSFSLPSSRLRLDVEIVNVTDRKNVCCVDEFLFEPKPDGTVDVQRELNDWLGITPSFSLVWEF